MNHIVCPSHTEGCGAAGDAAYNHRYERLMVAHALHPTVCRALFLDHGCEKVASIRCIDTLCAAMLLLLCCDSNKKSYCLLLVVRSCMCFECFLCKAQSGNGLTHIMLTLTFLSYRTADAQRLLSKRLEGNGSSRCE
jgi:hypothetical protein